MSMTLAITWRCPDCNKMADSTHVPGKADRGPLCTGHDSAIPMVPFHVTEYKR